jgi:hypothetical protein
MYIHFITGETETWNLGEPKPTYDPDTIEYIKASGPELEAIRVMYPALTPVARQTAFFVYDIAQMIWLNI